MAFIHAAFVDPFQSQAAGFHKIFNFFLIPTMVDLLFSILDYRMNAPHGDGNTQEEKKGKKSLLAQRLPHEGPPSPEELYPGKSPGGIAHEELSLFLQGRGYFS